MYDEIDPIEDDFDYGPLDDLEDSFYEDKDYDDQGIITYDQDSAFDYDVEDLLDDLDV